MCDFIEAIVLIVRNVKKVHVAIQVDTSLKNRVLDAVITSDAGRLWLAVFQTSMNSTVFASLRSLPNSG